MTTLKLNTLSIPDDDPFKYDQMDRKPEIENLTSLISNTNTPMVLAIDAEWGSGKTTFIKIWEKYLSSKDIQIQSFYFNAWATDFSDDPLVSFLGEINESLGKTLWSRGGNKKAWKKTLKAGKQVIKRAIPVAIKIGTAGVIDADKLIEDEASKFMEGLSSDALDDYLKQKDAISTFKDSLGKLIETSSKDKPIIIFVDELDRCRPTYAIALLERIKHLFDIEGLVFVLALAKEQLSHSVGAVYGSNFDSNSYLKRFIDFEYNLKEPKIDDYISNLFRELSLDQRLESRKNFRELMYDANNLKKTFASLAKYHQLPLREIEQLLARINLAIITAKENQYIYPELLVFLIITKSKYPKKYQQYINDGNSESEMVQHLYSISPKKERLTDWTTLSIEALLISAKLKHEDYKDNISIISHREKLESTETSNEEKQYSQRLASQVEHLTGFERQVSISGLINRIEMLDQFHFEIEVKT